MMALQSGNNDVGISSEGISSELRARDLPSKHLLGKGLASIVYETEWKGERFARKDFIGVPSGVFQRESAILVGLQDHENVVKTHGRTVDKMSCSLVLEYMEEDLLDLLLKRKESQGVANAAASDRRCEGNPSYPFELAEALAIISQIARGMEFLHEQNIPHGDLKTNNILVSHINDEDKNVLSVKVADFGLVRTKSNSMSFVSRQARKLDVVQWKAPEVLERLLSEDNDVTSSESDSNSDTECTGSVDVSDRLGADVYSFAVTCSQILTGEFPYPNGNWKELGPKIVSGELRPNLPAACPGLLKGLLESCWTKSLAQRPTFSVIRERLERLVDPEVPGHLSLLEVQEKIKILDNPPPFKIVSPQRKDTLDFSNISLTSQASSSEADDHEFCQRVTRGNFRSILDIHNISLSQASSSEADDQRSGPSELLSLFDEAQSPTSFTTSFFLGSQQDNLDETHRKILGSNYLKTAIRMLTDYIDDLKNFNCFIDDSVQSRIEEYDTLLHELKGKQQEPDDSKSFLSKQDRGKLISMLLDYQTMLLSETLPDQAQQNEDVPDHNASYAQSTKYTELRTTNEVGEHSEARRVPVYLTDTDFQEGGYKELLTGSLALCAKQVHKFRSLLPCVIIFKRLCKYVVESLTPRAQLNCVRYLKTLSHLEEVQGGGEISSSLRNSASFCFESLVGLARRFHLVADLLTKCGSPDWHLSALELADVRPSKHKLRWSEFSLAIRNCQWSMDLVELAFHALQKLLEEGTYSVKDATFKWSEEKGRMVLQILSDREFDSQNSVNQESWKLQEDCRDLEEKDLTDLIEKLKQLMASEKEKQPFYQGASSAHKIAKYLSNKLSGPIPVAGDYLPYTFKIDAPGLKYREYLDIGSGGMVAIHDWHKVQVAVKSVRWPIRVKFEEEAAVLGMVQHPNVVRLIGYGFVDKTDIGLLVMELMDHDLRYIIDSRLKVLPERSNPFAPIMAIDIMLQIGQAMLYLGEHNILHRDLKAKNILVNICKPLALQVEADSPNTGLMRQFPAVSAVLPHIQENYVAKLAGFGSAECRSHKSSYARTTMVGTTGWRAPEVFKNTKGEAYESPADVYSFGMLCYEIWTGKSPFEEEQDHGVGLQAKIMAGVRPLLRPDVPDVLRELIQQCWATNAAERPSFEAIVQKLWECKVQVILSAF